MLHQHWTLKSDMPLNHASFGATPNHILNLRKSYQKQFDENREGFLNDQYFDLLKATQRKISDFVGTQPKNLVLISNATEGFNAVFQSLPLKEGDEILTTDQIYSNFPPILKEIANKKGATVKTVEIPFPIENDEEIIDAITSAVSKKTKLAFFDHITSASSITFPVKDLVNTLKNMGIETFIDGAQSTGQVHVDIDDIGATYYVGNHHKWVCAPTSSAFLYVSPDKQDCILPAIMSGASTREHSFQDRFKWTGTFDPSALLCVSDTIDFMQTLHPNGWKGIFEQNHNLAVKARNMLTKSLNLPKLCPNHMIGSMFSIELGHINFPNHIRKQPAHRRLAKLLSEHHGFELYGLASENGNVTARVSAHLYNDRSQYERLTNAMTDIMNKYGTHNHLNHDPTPSYDL